MMNKLMKKMVVALTAATMAITAASVVTYANDGQGIETMDVSVSDCYGTKYVIASSANVRTAPSTNSRILYELSYGDVIEVDGLSSNGWYRFITTDPVYGGETGGYVYADLLSDNGYTPQHDGNIYNVGVQSGYLALRNSPNWTDDDSNVIEEMYNGQQFGVIEKCGQYWYGYSVSSGRCGYVNADFLY